VKDFKKVARVPVRDVEVEEVGASVVREGHNPSYVTISHRHLADRGGQGVRDGGEGPRVGILNL